MTLDDFPAVKDCLLKFFSTINLGDFIEFNYLYSDYVGGVYVPRYLKIKYVSKKGFETVETHWNGYFIEQLGRFHVEEIRGEELTKFVQDNTRDIEFIVDGRMLYASIHPHAKVSYLQTTAYHKLSQTIVGVEFGLSVDSDTQTTIIDELKKTYNVDFKKKCERIVSEDIVFQQYCGGAFQQYYNGHKINRKCVSVKLLFEYHPNKRLIFSWDKSSKCFVGKFDNGEKLKRLGWLTVSQDAVAALKQFGKEPDNSFGNKTIAKRMKKYIYL
jgi:hypothetical protein